MLVIIVLVLLLLVWMLANYVALTGWFYGCLIIAILFVSRRHAGLVIMLTCAFLGHYYFDYSGRHQSIDATVSEVNKGGFSQQLSFHEQDLRIRIDQHAQIEPNCLFSGQVSWRYRPAPEDYGNRSQRQQQLVPHAYSDNFEIDCSVLQSAVSEAKFPRLRALVQGHFRLLNANEVEQLRRTGTLHLFVVSGLHIGVIYLAISWLSRRVVGLYTARKLSLLAICCYLIWVAWGVAVGRVWLMILFAAITWWSARIFNRYAILTAVALSMLLWAPQLIWRPGFWYSFSAVLCILTLYVGAKGGGVTKVSAAQLSISLLSAGISQLPTNPFQSFATNLILVPLWGLVVPSALLALILPFEQLSQFLEAMLELIIRWLPSTGTPWLSINADWYLALFALSVYVIIISPGSFKLLGGFLLVITWFTSSQLSQLRIHDVGQGSAVSVLSEANFSLYDTGFGSTEFGAVVQRTIWPQLVALKPRHVNYFLSHSDADHAGGLAAMRELRPSTRFNGLQSCSAGQRWQIGNARTLVLWPRYSQRLLRNNSASCAWLIELDGLRVLVLGDMGLNDELAMLRMWPNLTADIAVLAHHGSATSTSYALLSKVRPKFAIISSGQDNRFGHPSNTVIHKLSQFGVKTLVTAKVGTITFSKVDDVELIRLSCLELISAKDCKVSVN
ncbi:ComEC/Rec2 family competence protein [uncultured Umboniibacter sp.]|uniref:ComEC/Rec2 family competence protein n=1 Tax=uncultured Umboniibacter sp. TaxID=1798917 RepID=UPI0026389D73|nr:ComEC/Rec2 family competence protein [uncultured Umboniibacter sp.]